MTIDEMKMLADGTARTALAKGTDTAQVTVSESSEFEVVVRSGKIENLLESVSNRIAVTLSLDKRKASATSTDLSAESISQLVSEAVELAEVMDRDEYFDLPDPEELGRAVEDLAVYDTGSVQIPTGSKIGIALELEETARRLDGRIISDGASFSNGVRTIAIANSLGFCDGYSRTFNSMGISCAAEDTASGGENKGKKQSSYWYSAATSYSGLDPVEEIASRAVSRTIVKLGAIKPRTCEVPVVFDTETAGEFMGYLAAALNGGSIYRKASFLVDKVGERIGSPRVTIIDDPLLKQRLGARPFDSEGVRSRRNTVVEKGILRSYLMSSYQARKLRAKTTGSAGGVSNFYMKPGKHRLGDIIEGIGEGLYLTSLSGPGANWTTGDFSQGAQGIWIEGGELSSPVDGFTVAGSFPQILGQIEMVANDLDWRRPLTAPSFKVGGMTVSGT